MDIDIVRDAITKIMERMSSLSGVFGIKTTTVADNITLHLSTIKGVNTPKVTIDWLIDVTDVLTDLWDLLEDHNVCGYQSNVPFFLSLSKRRLLLQLDRMEKRLQQIAGDSTKLLSKNSTSLTSSDLKDRETEMVGREYEKEKIVEAILAQGKVKGVVPVYTVSGMQGIGKTTLAKLVCDDERVKSNFDFVIWIDGIGKEPYAESISKRVIDEAATAKKKKEFVTVDENLDLSKGVNGSNFFLVLDDFRNENREEWLRLKQKLEEAARSSGGGVLVTTRDSLVSEIVTGSNTMTLDELNEEDSWTLFEKIIAGRDLPYEPKNRDTKTEMVRICRGIPKAIVTMARIWRSREDSGDEFTPEMVKNMEVEFMQEMQFLYYEELPFWHLKLCFSYLSFIFTARNSLDAETVIWIWMAEGFLGFVNSSSSCLSQQPEPEELGFNIIREFRRRSIFLVDTEQFDFVREFSVSVNGFLLDLSTFVAGKDRFFMDNNGDNNVKEKVSRMSLTPSSFDVSKSLTENNRSFRTILFPMLDIYYSSSRIPHEVELNWSALEAIFGAFRNLRVLNLSDLGIRILPISIGNLKNLRYLNLSHNNMKRLPTTIGKLKQLQTLILSHCHQLIELPNAVKHLVNLRHLEMNQCLHLTHMPSELKKLTKLQRLSHFVASKNHSQGGLGELSNLNNLGGKLEISHLEQLKFNESKRDVHARLKEKQNLSHLCLKWNHNGDYDDGAGNNHDEITLRHLEPHPNLRKLSIEGYRGTKFSGWLSFLKNIVMVTLYNCASCKSLPPLNHFPKLVVLELKRLDSLEYITDQDEEDCNELGFECLKELTISDCPKLTSWWKNSGSATHNNNTNFPSLSSLNVTYCPKLDFMPLFPNLERRLALVGSSMKPLLDTINCTSTSSMPYSYPLSKLNDFVIADVEGQYPLPQDWLKNFTSLRFLWITEKMSLMKGLKHLTSLRSMVLENCTEVDLLPSDEWEGLPSLTVLYAMELKTLPEGIKNVTSLTNLCIMNCPELTTLIDGIGNLISLKYLFIKDCPKLVSLPEEIANLSSLSKLEIINCPLLLPRCQKGTGDDWPQIKHIKNIILIGTSQVFEQ